MAARWLQTCRWCHWSVTRERMENACVRVCVRCERAREEWRRTQSLVAQNHRNLLVETEHFTSDNTHTERRRKWIIRFASFAAIDSVSENSDFVSFNSFIHRLAKTCIGTTFIYSMRSLYTYASHNSSAIEIREGLWRSEIVVIIKHKRTRRRRRRTRT